MLAETPRGRRLVPLLRFAALVMLCVCAPGASKRSSHTRRSRPCPHGCSCGPNGHDKLAWRADCTKLGLCELPSPLDPFTTLLDLSMNNFTSLPPAAFSHLQALRELRLAGNDLVDLSTNCFSGLKNLRVLTLQNNQFHHVPGHALQNLPNLQSLRFDANHIEAVPAGSFSALHRLRHLWFDDNALQAVPIEALGELPSLQALTLALNHIRIIPSMAFKKLSNLIVLRLHNNHIERLESRCFEGLHSLDYLDLNDNRLTEFPTEIVSLPRLQELAFHSNNIAYIPEHAFKGNPLLHTIHFYDNPIKYVGHSTFQNLHKLQTLLMHGPSEMETFPDLNGTLNLRSLTLTGTRIASLPSRFCANLQNLTFLDFSDNQLREMPTLNFCRHLAEVNLRRNEIAEVGEFTLHHLNLLKSLEIGSSDGRSRNIGTKFALDLHIGSQMASGDGNGRTSRFIVHHDVVRATNHIRASSDQVLARDLSENRINVIHPRAFVTLSKLNKLDLSRNSLLHLPTAGLAGLTQLKLGGNPMLFDLPPPSTFHDLRSLEVPFPYHCCAFGPSVWVSHGEQQSHSKEGNHASFPVDIEDLEPDDYIQDLDSNLQPEIHCSPSPGPLQPCDNLLGGWLVRLGVWFLSGTGIIANALVVILTFSGSRSPPLSRRLLGLLAGANLATGFHGGALSVMDGAWFGHFAQIGPRWESSLGCRLAAFLAVWAAESALLVMAVVVAERASYCLTRRNKSRPSRCRFVGPAAVLAITGAGLLAAPQLAGGLVAGPLCLPLPGLPGSSPYFTATLVLLNTVVFLGMVVACAGLHCILNKAQQAVEAAEQAMVRHITWLVFVNGLLFFPAAFFGISALLHPVVVPPTVSRSIFLLFLPLPACLNPLLYLLFSPRARLEVTALHAVLCCRGWHRPPTIATTVSVTPSTQAWTRPLLSARKPAIATGASHICLVPCRFANDGIDSSSQSGTTDEEELGTSSRPPHGFLFLDHS